MAVALISYGALPTSAVESVPCVGTALILGQCHHVEVESSNQGSSVDLHAKDSSDQPSDSSEIIEDAVPRIITPAPPPPLRDTYHVTGPLTLEDIASFRPVPGTDNMEPKGGWGVVGLDTNFFATVSTSVVSGTLLDKSAQVRFTPVQYRWTYGDGTSASRSTKGATWAAQGIHPFDPTPTSHIYREKGNYTITLMIDFRAEYSYDGSEWIPVAGMLAVPTNPLHTRVGTAKTVLVAKDCLQNPSGPGC